MLQKMEDIQRMKRDRKPYRRAIEKEWKFGTSTLVVGLKRNSSKDKCFARIAYLNNSTRESKVDEDVLMPSNWIQFYRYKSDVIQHVINMGQTDNGYVMVPPGMNIHVQNRAISQLTYVLPSTQTVPIGRQSVQEGKNSIVSEKQLRKRKAGVEMIETAVPHHCLEKILVNRKPFV